MTPHINAKKGEIASRVLMPGDPLRAKRMAEMFLTNVKEVNNVRNMLMFTGEYKGVPVSICGSGMGQPSIGIYAYELYKFYGVESIIRVGSAGSYVKDLNLYAIFLPTSSYSDNKSFNKLMAGKNSAVTRPSAFLVSKIRKASKRHQITIHEGRVHSSDVFYSARPFQEAAAASQAQCVEMESGALFSVANALKKDAACLLTISDNLVTKQETTATERQDSFTSMFKLALEAIIK